MTVHDQLFKELLEARLGDFLEIVVPHLAPHLDADHRRILPNETFTDRPRGQQRVLDLVAEVPDRHETGSELVLVHVEIERDRRVSMSQRMWAYARALALREDKSILPIVLYLCGGPSRPTKRTIRQTIAGEEMATFSYYAFGLSGSPAEEYVARPQPLAWALAALMKPPENWSPARHLIACIDPLTGLRSTTLDDATRHLLLHCMEAYIQLDQNDREEFELLNERHDRPRPGSIRAMWIDEQERRGKLSLVLRQLEARFGPVSESTREKLEAFDASEQFDDLAVRLLDAESLEDLGLA